MVKAGLPSLFLQRLHPQRPHELSDSDRRKVPVRVLLLCVSIKILLESAAQINFVGQPRVDRPPVGHFGFLIVTLLDDAQSLVPFHVKGRNTVDRMVAAVYLAVVVRPDVGRFFVVSHKIKESPKLSPQTLQSSLLSKDVLHQSSGTILECRRQRNVSFFLVEPSVHLVPYE